MEKKKFVIVVFSKGFPYILQMRGVLNWFFDNNIAKVYKTLKGATNAAKRLKMKYACEEVKVYELTDDCGVCLDNIRIWEKYQRERIVFVAD